MMKKLLLTVITSFVAASTLFAQTNSPSADEINAMQQNANAPSSINQSKLNSGSSLSGGNFVGCDSITTTYVGGNGLMGAMFDVVADSALIINGMYTNLAVDSGIFEIYYKAGTMTGYELNSSAWTLAGSSNIVSAGINVPTFVPIPISLFMNAGDTIGLYISNTTQNGFAGLKYTNGVGAGTLYTDNGALKIFEGNGMTYPFASIYADRVWNGTLNYCTLTTGISEQESSLLSISPNPVTDKAVFNFGNNKINSLVITSIEGKKVFEENNINSSNYTFKRNGLIDGIYFYEIFSDNNLIAKGKLLLN